MLPLALLLAAAPSLHARYLMTVEDVPLAELRVALEGREYVYESTHFLEEGDKARRLTFTLDESGRVDGLVPEVLALLRPPGKGCADVLEEVRRRREKLCVTGEQPDLRLGTLDDVPFTARYAKGRLVAIELAAAKWTASDEPARRGAAQPFIDGYAVEGDGPRVSLEPAVKGALVLKRSPTGTGTDSTVGRERCLVAARKALAAHGEGAELVLGLVLEDGRAFPHAWFRQGDQHFDPSVLRGDEVLAKRVYVSFPRELAGRLYLELLDGKRTVRRSP